jgi:hypothetical protein
MNAIQDDVAEERRLSGEINGQNQNLGFRGILAEYERLERNAVAELERLKPLRYNLQVEYALLKKRQNALDARIKELEGSSITSRQ